MGSILYSVGKASTNPVSGKKKYLPHAQVREVVSPEALASHIALHTGSFSRGTYMAVISELVDCLREQLLEGKKVQLGDLGNFCVSLLSHGADDYNSEAEDADNWSAAKIYGVRTIYEPSSYFTDLISDAQFEENMTREVEAQAKKDYRAANASTTTSGGVSDVG